ncbi:MAG TPA: thiamine phosphate synthase [Myxococcales bacterium]
MIRLYLITPPDGDPLPAVESALAALPRGVAGVQLRQPALAPKELLARARALRSICARFGATFLVNDRADVAVACGADGVHLPERGLSPADARKLGFSVVGVSVHAPGEVARAAREGADFAVFAPVYDTPGKSARGLDALREACGAAPLPVLALGGIDAGNAARCLSAGAAGVACIRSVLGSPDPGAAALRLWKALRLADDH